jgi:hypothetical protein
MEIEWILYVLGLGYGSVEGLRKHVKEGTCYKEEGKLSAFHCSPLWVIFIALKGTS